MHIFFSNCLFLIRFAFGLLSKDNIFLPKFSSNVQEKYYLMANVPFFSKLLQDYSLYKTVHAAYFSIDIIHPTIV